MRAARAVAPRDAPLSTESPAAAAAPSAATRVARRAQQARRVAYPIAGRPAACPPGAPSAPRGSGGTSRGAVRAHSTECRTGSTPGSPDQSSADHGARHGARLAAIGHRRVAQHREITLVAATSPRRATANEPVTGMRPGAHLRHAPTRRFRRSLDGTNSYLWLSTVSTGLSTVSPGYVGYYTASVGQPGLTLWITSGPTAACLTTPKWDASEKIGHTKQPPSRGAGCPASPSRGPAAPPGV